MVARNPATRDAGGVWVFPGGGVEPDDGAGEERPARGGGARARRGGRDHRRRGRRSSCPSRAGSPRSACRCASTPTSSWRARRRARSPRPTASSASTPAGSPPARCSPRARRAVPVLSRPARTSSACGASPPSSELLADAARRDASPAVQPRLRLPPGEDAHPLLPGEPGYDDRDRVAADDALRTVRRPGRGHDRRPAARLPPLRRLRGASRGARLRQRVPHRAPLHRARPGLLPARRCSPHLAGARRARCGSAPRSPCCPGMTRSCWPSRRRTARRALARTPGLRRRARLSRRRVRRLHAVDGRRARSATQEALEADPARVARAISRWSHDGRFWRYEDVLVEPRSRAVARTRRSGSGPGSRRLADARPPTPASACCSTRSRASRRRRAARDLPRAACSSWAATSTPRATSP